MFFSHIKYLFSTKDKRNMMLRKNILFSAILKVIGLCSSLLIVPITLEYLSSEVYGIWLTMSSVLYWFAFFDVGLGNGMRNYLTGAISVKDYNADNKHDIYFIVHNCIVIRNSSFCLALRFGFE